MRKILILAACLAMVMAAPSASALGKKERNVLATVGALFIFSKAAKAAQKHQEKVKHENSEEAQIERAYMEGSERRRIEELAERKRKAYQCGYRGICE